MASEGGSAMPGRDLAWKYCSPIKANEMEQFVILWVDDNDEDAEDEDVYMYPDMHRMSGMHIDLQIRASKASNRNMNNMRIL
ncbi:hypothetical protein AAG906_010971 [Vitis piasezkii]